MITLLLIIALALSFDFINGFHDTANAIATAVSTRALTLRGAILLATCMNFLGAVLFTGVAETIATGIVDLKLVADGSLILITALASAIIWNLITWYFGIPNSSSHALIGAMIERRPGRRRRPDGSYSGHHKNRGSAHRFPPLSPSPQGSSCSLSSAFCSGTPTLTTPISCSGGCRL